MKREVIEKLSALITAGFGLVAALAWNDAIQSLFKEEGLLHFLAKYGQWGYALIVTIVAVLFTMWIGRVAERAKGREKARNKK